MTPMIWKVISHGQLLVFWRGQLIYKRRLDEGYGLVFDPYGLPFRPGERGPKT